MINYRLLAVVSLLVGVFAVSGLLRLDIDTDVVRSLPSGEKIIDDGLDIFQHHPVHDQIAVDIMIDIDDPDALVEIGAFLEKKMLDSDLFVQVGTDAVNELIPELANHAVRNLPLLFSQKELEENIAPLLGADQINKRIGKLYQDLSSMNGIGQAGFISRDPFGFKDLVLGRMAPLAPSMNVRFYRGSLISKDGLHLLITARPHATGTDTGSARRISELIMESSRDIAEKYGPLGMEVTLTPVGAYRAALDNERIIRHDVQLALLLATAGVGLLLFFAFPRPLIGLLSLVPALAGTSAALFVYSLFHSSISIMVLGFGGAIISITVDHGLAYLLFLDRTHETRGKDASHEVRVIGIMAIVTSVGAFLILSCSGFPIFTELGQFAAFGIFFSFLFVHSVFPRIFPTMPPSSGRDLPLHGIVNILYNTGKPGAVAAGLLVFGLLFFARPQFHVNLSSMNTVSDATLAADMLFTEVWGDVDERIILMNSADTIGGIQENNDKFLAKIDHDIKTDVLTAGFVPSMIFPGRERGEQNLSAWHEFWDDQRTREIKEVLRAAGSEYGFSPDAFAGFFSLLDPLFTVDYEPIPVRYYNLLGISKNEKNSTIIQFITVLPGVNYNGAELLARYGGDGKIFDAAFFTDRLAEILFSTFTTMLVIIAVSVSLLLYLFYLNLALTLITLLPPLFAYICTLGTLNLIGRPLDIPAVMLSVVIFGLGIDYSIFCVRAHQRYRDIDHPSYALVRVAVFMSAISSLVGFGVLCVAEHSLLKSIGVTSLLGIGYSLLGTFLLLPPLLDRYLTRENRKIHLAKNNSIDRIRHRFQTLEAYPRMFARFKLQCDPMFNDLPRMLNKRGKIKIIIDIGCGYGVPACWCLEHYEGAEISGLDPDPERVRVAAIATSSRGMIKEGWAPDLPSTRGSADVVLLLDMLHYLDDEIAAAVFSKSYQGLGSEGILVTRFVLRPSVRPSWSWRLEDSRVKLSGRRPCYRSTEKMAELMREAGFVITVNEVSAANPELAWMVGRTDKEMAGVEKKP